MVEDIVRGKGYLTLGSRMKRIGERLQGEVQQLIDGRGVSIQAGHYPLLACLDENGPLAIGDLAEALGVSQPGVTRTVGQLARQKVVAVRRGRQDQRTKLVELTAGGRALVDEGRREIWPEIVSCLTEIMEGRSGDLLAQLDALEDGLKAKSFAVRVAESAGNRNHD